MCDSNLERLKKIELEILDEIIRLCEKHDIHYVLMGGSCLGAVRYRGMIPWDDDIDLGMNRSDYDRFKEICKKELNHNYFLQDMDSDYYSGFIFGKIRKNHTYMSEEYEKNVKMHHGIWVDVFPFDYVDDNIIEHEKTYKKLLFYRNLFIIKQGFKIKKEENITKKCMFYIVRSFIWMIPLQYLKNKIQL